MNETALMYTEGVGYPLLSRGKVRDVYDLQDALLVVATDRISCFDVVLPTPIPGKGRVLTQLSRFWFEALADVIPNHYIGTDLSGYVRDPNILAQLDGRSMLVRKAKPLPIEAIVRGYLSGSAWKEYARTGAFRGLALPAGLRESDPLSYPVYTPSTKAEQGLHDENITFDETVHLVGKNLARAVRDASLQLYRKAADLARRRGIIMADTKFEFGLVGNEVILIDEVLTPDSSRFWPTDGYAPGGPQPSFDKQYVRDWLEDAGWNKTPPAPALPEDVVRKTSEKYQEALRRLTAKP
ncbi:MAG TPA: phosphoribosylaminoimidazolesuccinocarboxamide synthase [Verrucomicrobia bacterium]|nr:MAG: phosphoribosylaminoimidazolesuccinocarboxamide synthase [Lentisphaerae bacterium GWF2_57_35]HBA84854.1 phosphoribosylaminoimidazolesuccinocarboxamide synthase [Verrucomicrobiota bacterium]